MYNYLFSGAETRVCDHSGINPFMLAIKNGSTHLNVAKAMAKMDPSLVMLKLDSGLTVSNWAQEKGHDGFFKVCFVTVLCLASLLPFLCLHPCGCIVSAVIMFCLCCGCHGWLELEQLNSVVFT